MTSVYPQMLPEITTTVFIDCRGCIMVKVSSKLQCSHPVFRKHITCDVDRETRIPAATLNSLDSITG